jgi:hypothetical protein
MRGKKDSRQDAEYTRGELLIDAAFSQLSPLPWIWNLAEVLVYSKQWSVRIKCIAKNW